LGGEERVAQTAWVVEGRKSMKTEQGVFIGLNVRGACAPQWNLSMDLAGKGKGRGRKRRPFSVERKRDWLTGVGGKVSP